MNYLTRLTHNLNDWTCPSGPAHKAQGSDAFEAIYDFGFEEWLFAEKHRIGNYQYGYIEGLNTFFGNREYQKLPLILFTLKYKRDRQGPSSRSIVAIIYKWEFLPNWKVKLSDTNVQKQWYDGMADDLSRKLDGQKLREAQRQLSIHYDTLSNSPKPLFNVRFSFNSTNINKDLKFEDIDLGRYNRFKLYIV